MDGEAVRILGLMFGGSSSSLVVHLTMHTMSLFLSRAMQEVLGLGYN